jgi:CBS domain-containing protein
MCVAEIMIPNPITVSPANSIGTAIRRMRASGCRCLPVVEGDRLVGIVTDYELSRAANSPLVAPEAHIRDVARLVCESDIGGIPVVRGHILVGLVTTANLLHHLIRLLGG